MPASLSAWATALAPRSWPSSPGFATNTLKIRSSATFPSLCSPLIEGTRPHLLEDYVPTLQNMGLYDSFYLFRIASSHGIHHRPVPLDRGAGPAHGIEQRLM